ncbi:MAG: hypothetical protein ACE10I_08720, partial [Candidatus Acidiferrales bacterium]
SERVDMEDVQQAIVSLRNIRAEMKIDPKRSVIAELSSQEPGVLRVFRNNQEAIMRLANLSQLKLSDKAPSAESGVTRHTARFDANLPHSEADPASELKRLRKEKAKLERQLESTRAKLANQQFLRKAPQEVVQGIEFRKGELSTQYEKITSLLSTLEHRLGSDSPPSAGESR